MDKETMDNWLRIKESLEEAGATENFYYQRACAIVAGGKDPIDVKANIKGDDGA